MAILRVLPLVLLVTPMYAQLAKAIDLHERGDRASDAGRYEEAIGLYREASAIWSAAGPEYDGHRAATLLNLGVVVASSGDRQQGARVLEESLKLHRKALGERHHRTLANLNVLAGNYLVIGQFARAEGLLQEALPIERELYPADVQTARTLETLCNARVRSARPEEGLPLGEEALAIAIAATGEESLDTALAYSNVGEAHRGAGRPERALPLFRKARAIYEKTLGPDHPRVAMLLSQEGMILLVDGKVSMAEQLTTRAIDALERSCPKCAAEMAVAEDNLASVRLRQKRYRDADALLTDAIKLRESFTTTPGRELAGTLHSLAYVRQKEKLYADAERLNTRANTILSYR